MKRLICIVLLLSSTFFITSSQLNLGNLPSEIQVLIINALTQFKNPFEAGRALQSLAVANKRFNEIFTDEIENKKIIDALAKKFEISDTTAKFYLGKIKLEQIEPDQYREILRNTMIGMNDSQEWKDEFIYLFTKARFTQDLKLFTARRKLFTHVLKMFNLRCRTLNGITEILLEVTPEEKPIKPSDILQLTLVKFNQSVGKECKLGSVVPLSNGGVICWIVVKRAGYLKKYQFIGVTVDRTYTEVIGKPVVFDFDSDLIIEYTEK